MKIELVKKVEVEPGKGTVIWWVVKYDNRVKHFLIEADASTHYDQVKAHYEKYGTVLPIEETIKSEEI